MGDVTPKGAWQREESPYRSDKQHADAGHSTDPADPVNYCRVCAEESAKQSVRQKLRDAVSAYGDEFAHSECLALYLVVEQMEREHSHHHIPGTAGCHGCDLLATLEADHAAK